MSNNIDVCTEQLNFAKEEVRKNDLEIQKMDALTAQTLNDYNVAKADYTAKETLYNTALATFLNYKTVLGGWYKVGKDGSWPGGECESSCRSDATTEKFPSFAGQTGGANFEHSQEDNGWTRWCECRRPDPNTYANNGRALVTAQQNMNLAKNNMDSKESIYRTALARSKPSPKLNIACCTNSVTCASDSNCSEIIQSCEAKITDLSEAQKAEQAEKAAQAAQAAQAETNKIGQNSRNNTSNQNKSSSKNSSIFSSSSSIILSCCCIFLIAIIFIVMKNPMLVHV
jgi:hypothetical protein